MKKQILLVFMVAIVWACNPTSSDDQLTDTEGEEASRPNGEAVYKAYCTHCHGLQGDMGAAGAANLKLSQLTVEERMQVIKNGRGSMAALGSVMSEEEIEAVANYSLSLKE